MRGILLSELYMLAITTQTELLSTYSLLVPSYASLPSFFCVCMFIPQVIACIVYTVPMLLNVGTVIMCV